MMGRSMHCIFPLMRMSVKSDYLTSRTLCANLALYRKSGDEESKQADVFQRTLHRLGEAEQIPVEDGF